MEQNRLVLQRPAVIVKDSEDDSFSSPGSPEEEDTELGIPLQLIHHIEENFAQPPTQFGPIDDDDAAAADRAIPEEVEELSESNPHHLPDSPSEPENKPDMPVGYNAPSRDLETDEQAADEMDDTFIQAPPPRLTVPDGVAALAAAGNLRRRPAAKAANARKV